MDVKTDNTLTFLHDAIELIIKSTM